MNAEEYKEHQKNLDEIAAIHAAQNQALNRYAFPGRQMAFIGTEEMEIPTHGLTKREYFAAMAMQGIITANHKIGHGKLNPIYAQVVISDSLQYADELLKQLGS